MNRKLFIKQFPPQGGGISLHIKGYPHCVIKHGGVRAKVIVVVVVVVVVVESYCFLINIIVDPGGAWPPPVY